MKFKAYAKLNLNLHIIPQKNKDGLYPVSFLNCQIDLADEIEINKSTCSKSNFQQAEASGGGSNLFGFQSQQTQTYLGSEIEIKCQGKPDCYSKECPKSCLVYQAAKILQKRFPQKLSGLKIKIKKNIPSRAGLGGGSADAAVVLKSLNKLYNLGLSQKQLLKIASQLGKDVCYCLIGGLAKVEGNGEKIIPLDFKMPKYYLVITVPKEKKLSTAWAYQQLDKTRIGRHLKKLDNILAILKSGKPYSNLLSHLHNDFESSIFKYFPQLKRIRQKLLNLGAGKVLLAGAGLSIVGFFKAKEAARFAFNSLDKEFNKFLTETI